MQVKPLYKYTHKTGRVVVSPVLPLSSYQMLYRIVADEGKQVTNNGKDFYSVIDVADPTGWYEVEIDDNSIDYSE